MSGENVGAAAGRVLKSSEYVTAEWSGGTTTQLLIHPEGASYAERTFLWRISSATVDVKVSNFTILTDYERWICPLRGEMRLQHNGGEEICLAPFMLHRFPGKAQTISRGCCTDFNLMLRQGAADGKVEHLTLRTGRRCWEPEECAEELLLYCAEGPCAASAGGQIWRLEAGESLVLHKAKPLWLEGVVQTHLMACQMWRI